MKVHILSVLLACSCASTVSAAEQLRLPTNEDLRHVRAIAAPQVSPDGKHILVALTDDTASGAAGHFWLVDPEKDSVRQITFSPPNDKRGEKSARRIGIEGIDLGLGDSGKSRHLRITAVGP